MNSSEDTRHTARMMLVESSGLKEEERLWSPGNPLEFSARDWTSTGPDYHQDIWFGRTPEWKRRYLVINVLGIAIAAAFMALFAWFTLYGPNYGVVTAMALFLTGAASLGAAAFVIWRTVVSLEAGFHTYAREDHMSKNKKKKRV
jgi:hypothetical protein